MLKIIFRDKVFLNLGVVALSGSKLSAQAPKPSPIFEEEGASTLGSAETYGRCHGDHTL